MLAVIQPHASYIRIAQGHLHSIHTYCPKFSYRDVRRAHHIKGENIISTIYVKIFGRVLLVVLNQTIEFVICYLHNSGLACFFPQRFTCLACDSFG